MVPASELVQGASSSGGFKAAYIPPHMRGTRMMSGSGHEGSSNGGGVAGGGGGGADVATEGGDRSDSRDMKSGSTNDRSFSRGGGAGRGRGGDSFRRYDNTSYQSGGGGGNSRDSGGSSFYRGNRGMPMNGSGGDVFNRSRQPGGSRDHEADRKYEGNPLIAQNVDELFEKPHTGINFDKYDDIPVEMTGRDAPSPVASFEEANLHSTLLATVRKIGFSKPTPVQKYSMGIGSARRDIMACAQTGSGKTAAFLLPIFNRLLTEDQFKRESTSSRGGSGGGYRRVAMPDGLILAPTRELALQIYEECRKFTYGGPLKSAVVYGGDPIRGQVESIRRDASGLNILVATPGRLIDIISSHNPVLSMEKVRFLVLDEADRMLDMGFEPQIRDIVEKYGMPESNGRQTFMFSATFPREIQRLARDFLHDYMFLTVGRVGAATENVKQTIIEVPEHEKPLALVELLQGKESTSVLVFVERRRDADDLADFLISHHFKVNSIHGDRTQSAREFALDSFKRGQIPILVATAVAARGLDIPTVGLVINFNMPASIDQYVHQIGRTGRAGNTGEAISLINDKVNKDLLKDLKFTLKDNKQEVPECLERLIDRLGSRGGGGGGGSGGGAYSSTFAMNRGPRGGGGSSYSSNMTGPRSGGGSSGSGTLQDTTSSYRGNFRSTQQQRGFGGQDFRMTPEMATSGGSSSTTASLQQSQYRNPSSGPAATADRSTSSRTINSTTTSRAALSQSKSSRIPSAWSDEEIE